jgi:hypothetical protein
MNFARIMKRVIADAAREIQNETGNNPGFIC